MKGADDPIANKIIIVSTIIILISIIFIIYKNHVPEKKQIYDIIASYDYDPRIQKDIIASLYLLPNLRTLILCYEGENSMLNRLKEIFKYIETKDKNPALFKMLADLEKSKVEPLQNLPLVPLVVQFKNEEKKNKEFQRNQMNKQDVEFLNLFTLEGKDNEFKELPNVLENMNRFAFRRANKRCDIHNCPIPIYEGSGDEMKQFGAVLPIYYIAQMPPHFELNNPIPLDAAFLLKIYPFNHHSYDLCSFHVIFTSLKIKKVISCYKADNGKWINMFDGNEIEENQITSLLSRDDCFIKLFYTKTEEKVK